MQYRALTFEFNWSRIFRNTVAKLGEIDQSK